MIKDSLVKQFGIKRMAPMKEKNTLRLAVSARYYLEIASERRLLEAIGAGVFSAGNFIIIGGGSNILFKDDFQGLVVKLVMRGTRIVYEDENHVHIEVCAGECWSDFVRYAVSRGWGGVENLALIPGSAGAAPIQNIAAYGHSLHDRLLSVQAVSRTDGSARCFSNAQCRFGYRDSIFKNELKNSYLITSICLKLAKKPVLNTSYTSRYESIEDELSKIARPPYSIRDVYQAVVAIRKRKLPDIQEVGSAGSFFKNPVISRAEYIRLGQMCPGIQCYPAEQLDYSKHQNPLDENVVQVKIPAAWLIAELGLAGRKIGNCGIWPRQPLNIVNYGDGKPAEVLELMNLVVTGVKERFGLTLEPEVEIVG